MTQTTHTPGPWELLWEKSREGETIVQCRESLKAIAWVSDEANARLIAAAPDLLEVVQAMANFDGRNNNKHLKDMAHTSIAKATGKAGA